MALQNMTGKLAAGWPRRRDEAASIARLAPLEPVRDNPGQLNGLFFVPDTVARPMPLVAPVTMIVLRANDMAEV